MIRATARGFRVSLAERKGDSDAILLFWIDRRSSYFRFHGQSSSAGGPPVGLTQWSLRLIGQHLESLAPFAEHSSQRPNAGMIRLVRR